MEKEKMNSSLKNLIQQIQSHLNEHNSLTPKRAAELVAEANVTEEDLMPFADFNHPVEDCYGRRLVHETDQFEVMVMSWNPGDYSSIHNHGYTEWGVVQVFGNTHHFIFHVKDNTLCFSKKEIIPSGSVVKVNNALIHQMGNTSGAPYLTLHVYGVNQKDNGITDDAMNFDLAFDRIAYTSGGAFFKLPSEAINRTEPGVIPSDEVLIHYAYLYMDYCLRQEPSEEISRIKEQIVLKMEQLVNVTV
ncbi:cysteine dioxygenase family protein [Aureitalea sp. L0-47]|uniref:cysteine dioxygenase n=1 Tax=Aureitalea sp. L0-47 TaxID=2816962 RepID=UPI0022391122|nr:cysteine dioxygenase family protein [Aureitalea sp. L0-47]MCW5519851.1 cysteine dioxygenase family protein [Aureitalea sp. L0-47]